MADQSYRCRWCGHDGDAQSTNCSACGAPTDIRLAVTKSGWTQLPPIRDMAKIQFGESFCQIEGHFVPVADFKLAAQDKIFFAHHLMLWKDEKAQLDTLPMPKSWRTNSWKPRYGDIPLIMAQATGPGHIAFSEDKPGELIALPMSPGQSVQVRENVFMVATHGIEYECHQATVWFITQNGKETETFYPAGYMIEHFKAGEKPGFLLLHGGGNVFVRNLPAGHSILIKPTAFLFKDSTVNMVLHVEHPGGESQSSPQLGNRNVLVRLTGPGRVAIQSNIEPLEDSLNPIMGTSRGATKQDWNVIAKTPFARPLRGNP